jgi:hypothetical protein
MEGQVPEGCSYGYWGPEEDYERIVLVQTEYTELFK